MEEYRWMQVDGVGGMKVQGEKEMYSCLSLDGLQPTNNHAQKDVNAKNAYR